MCGLAGIMFRERGRPVAEDVLRAMGDCLAHRGSDAAGTWTSSGVGMAHRRLSIIDLAGGDQPLANEDDSIQVIFNGEIYNHRNLHTELRTRGHQFRTASDTEVLVHLYEDHGAALVERLRGMFAFAIFDKRKHQLLLARDRVGLKPLYYYRDNERVVFGSEIKAILATGGVDRAVDPAALDAYLTLGFVPAEQSIFHRIRKLPPGHTLTISAEQWQAEPRRYWSLEANALQNHARQSWSELEWQEAISAKIKDSVAAHKVSDVPVGALLSGGLDSSAIVATMAEQGTPPATVFTIGFDDETRSEIPYARQVAEKFGCRHVTEIVQPGAIASLDELVRHFDEPFADSSAIPMLLVSRLAAQEMKVVLSGDGGDEAFGGYARYAHDLAEDRWRRRLPAWLRRAILAPLAAAWPKADWLPRPLRAKTRLTNLSLDAVAAYANTLTLCRGRERTRLLAYLAQGDGRRETAAERIEAAYRRAPSDDALAGMIAADVAIMLPDDFLVKVDRASMAYGLEVRPPLVDHELLELAAQMPSQLKIRGGQSKWMLHQLFASRLPAAITHRRKQGFEIPTDAWLRHELRETFVDLVLRPAGRIGTLINTSEAARLFARHRQGIGRHGNVLWALLVLARWAEEYLSPARAVQSAAPPVLASVPNGA